MILNKGLIIEIQILAASPYLVYYLIKIYKKKNHISNMMVF